MNPKEESPIIQGARKARLWEIQGARKARLREKAIFDACQQSVEELVGKLISERLVEHPDYVNVDVLVSQLHTGLMWGAPNSWNLRPRPKPSLWRRFVRRVRNQIVPDK